MAMAIQPHRGLAVERYSRRQGGQPLYRPRRLERWVARRPHGSGDRHVRRGNPKFQIKFDPDAARKLMAESGYSKDKRLKVKTQTSASGSGQMLPLPMNERVHP